MLKLSRPRPIVILGPTAGGKSELAVDLATAVGGEVIGADSMQVYRYMDAGTAKPPPEVRRRVPHHLIDIVEPTERFTVADWLRGAERIIEELVGRGVWPIVVGGTNLYIKALLEGMFEGPGHDPGLRAELAGLTGEELHERLGRVDPAAAGRIHVNDRKKLIRALEVYEQTGRPISELQTQWGLSGAGAGLPGGYRHDPILIGLEWEVAAINRRINQRVKRMFFPEEFGGELGGEEGEMGESLPEEVARLEGAGLLGPQAREALGYKQVLGHLAGRMSLEEAFEQTKILTRRFAKTQRTWLKRFRGVSWFAAGELGREKLCAAALEYVGDAS